MLLIFSKKFCKEAKKLHRCSYIYGTSLIAMKEGNKITPEWIPAAYKDDLNTAVEKDVNIRAQPSAPLYSSGKTRLKSGLSKVRKKA